MFYMFINLLNYLFLEINMSKFGLIYRSYDSVGLELHVEMKPILFIKQILISLTLVQDRLLKLWRLVYLFWAEKGWHYTKVFATKIPSLQRL